MPYKLITKEVEHTALRYPMGSQDGKGEDAIAWLKFFDPCGRYAFYVTEANMATGELFGYVVSPLGSDCDEWGYSDLAEIQAVRNRMGLAIERDMHHMARPVSSILKFDREHLSALGDAQ